MRRGNKVSEYFNSFFKEQVIELLPSKINPQLEVALINGRYQLNAGNVNYSFGPLHDAFRKYFHKDPPVLNADSKVLILGLGAGSVAAILHDELNFQCALTGVEIDEAVVQIARKHFSLDRMSSLTVVIDDAYNFIRNATEMFDLIVIDIYIDDFVPVQFETRAFLTAVSKLLIQGGKVVFNKLQPVNAGDTASKALLKVFESVFEKTSIFEIKINKDSPNYFIIGIK
jgi:spermidine synthase